MTAMIVFKVSVPIPEIGAETGDDVVFDPEGPTYSLVRPRCSPAVIVAAVRAGKIFPTLGPYGADYSRWWADAVGEQPAPEGQKAAAARSKRPPRQTLDEFLADPNRFADLAPSEPSAEHVLEAKEEWQARNRWLERRYLRRAWPRNCANCGASFQPKKGDRRRLVRCESCRIAARGKRNGPRG